MNTVLKHDPTGGADAEEERSAIQLLTYYIEGLADVVERLAPRLHTVLRPQDDMIVSLDDPMPPQCDLRNLADKVAAQTNVLRALMARVDL